MRRTLRKKKLETDRTSSRVLTKRGHELIEIALVLLLPAVIVALVRMRRRVLAVVAFLLALFFALLHLANHFRGMMRIGIHMA